MLVNALHFFKKRKKLLVCSVTSFLYIILSILRRINERISWCGWHTDHGSLTGDQFFQTSYYIVNF